MKAVIHKYSLNVARGPQELFLPVGAEIVQVAEQHGRPTLWAMVDAESTTQEPRTFQVVGTGHSIPDGESVTYHGCAFIGPFVWHVIER